MDGMTIQIPAFRYCLIQTVLYSHFSFLNFLFFLAAFYCYILPLCQKSGVLSKFKSDTALCLLFSHAFSVITSYVVIFQCQVEYQLSILEE